MKYAHILSQVTSTPWLISDSGASAITSLLNSRLSEVQLAGAEIEPASITETGPEIGVGVAYIPVRGILGKNLGMMETACGGCDINTVLAVIKEAMESPDVGVVALHIDSPGGAATGLPEAHAAIRQMRAQHSEKKIIAMVDGQCCSGGMYLAAACDSIACTKTAQLGSIGAVTHLAFKAMKNASEGIEVRTYKYGKFKDLGNPNRLPTPEEDAIIQARIDTLGKMFEADMRSARPNLHAEVFDALVYFGEQAVALELADELISSVDDYIEMLKSVRSV